MPGGALVRVDLRDGDDRLLAEELPARFPLVVDAGEGENTVAPGAGDDTIRGGSGRDTLYGGPGHDRIDGGDGNNYLRGNGGDDTITRGRRPRLRLRRRGR